MKDALIIVVCCFTILIVALVMRAPEEMLFGSSDKRIVAYEFDPNDPLVPFLSTPPETWLEKFGDSERSRTIYTIAELRVLHQQQQQMLDKLNTFCFSSDPNTVGGAK